MSTRAKQPGKFEKVGECLYRYSTNNVYYAVVRHEGKLIRRSLETDDAKLAKGKLSDFRNSLSQVDSSLGKMTIEELLKKFQATLKTLDANTIQKLGFVATHFRKDWAPGLTQAVRKVKPSEVDAWLGLMREKYAISYYNEHVQFVRRMFELAVADKAIAESPARASKTVKRETPIRQTPTWEQFKALVADVRSQKFNADADDSADFVDFLGRSGLGNSEAANIQRKHVDLEKGKITVLRNKTNQGYQIPIFPQLRPLVEKLMKQAEDKPDAHLLKVDNVKKALTNSCARLNLPHFSHRSMRRCFVTRCIELGLDFKTVAALQGHRDGGILIAKTYSHLRTEHLDSMAERLVDATLKA
ncbi:MAG: tyrosine-type recombinase/integrase [Prosthecobacter sp.]|uniref:tyrosine-type recombinase/integrase n=1 Tax=Prosthecobacter sp. TaxID=1965333 RepID=UPI003BAF37E6